LTGQGGMARIGRVTVPGWPYAITQRGKRRLPAIFAWEFRLTGRTPQIE
jgi:hypothetical protein